MVQIPPECRSASGSARVQKRRPVTSTGGLPYHAGERGRVSFMWRDRIPYEISGCFTAILPQGTPTCVHTSTPVGWRRSHSRISISYRWIASARAS